MSPSQSTLKTGWPTWALAAAAALALGLPLIAPAPLGGVAPAQAALFEDPCPSPDLCDSEAESAPSNLGESPAVVALGKGDSALWRITLRENVARQESAWHLWRGRDVPCDPGVCHDTLVTVTQSAWRLRVAVEHPYTALDIVDFAVYGPDCASEVEACPEHLSNWTLGGLAAPRTHEAFVDAPAVGTYVARVYAREIRVNQTLDDVQLDGFPLRLRAKLEHEPREPKEPERLLPNLRADPPYNLSFDGPMDNGCWPEETLERGAVRCLRLAFGWQNVGRGPFDLVLQPYTSELDASPANGTIHQRIHWSDGTTEDRTAGTYSLHPTHAHFHYDRFVKVELYRVHDPSTGAMDAEPAARAGKLGVCGHDWRMAEFEKFYQGVAGTHDSHGRCGWVTVGAQSRMGLTPGWLDIYGAGTPDNFIDFGANPDGHYLVLTEIDFEDRLLETKEKDNAGYALIRVEGTDVTLLARGHGRGPWDPDAIPVSPWPGVV